MRAQKHLDLLLQLLHGAMCARADGCPSTFQLEELHDAMQGLLRRGFYLLIVNEVHRLRREPLQPPLDVEAVEP
eukprot:CAMPEP_0117694324 /NCGR_PEP_ID=MMETSP0804-20121206/27385_1 /TAXON_ID=1074897 /ORGANISM="Tetraselmis astigmatica, Strain CCMP880" /LENGTH=73 /DNA_ID=CAMNT_0005508001 /DNA_START=249 /DNA_END=470 /DNA_ORIENTATION=+